MNSTSFIDSFDSSNPYKSTNGLYDPAKFQRNGDVGIANNLNSDLRNGFIFGDLFYAGAVAVKNTRNVQGAVATPYNATVPAANDPTWAAFSTYPSSVTNTAKQFVAGTSAAPALVKVTGDFVLPGGATFQLLPPGIREGFIQIWVTGKLNISGSARLLQDTRVHATWIVDKDIVTNGDSYKNGSGIASYLSFVGVGTGKVNLSGASNFAATLTAPSRDVSLSGGASLSGGIAAKTLTLGGNSSVHCDEALLGQVRLTLLVYSSRVRVVDSRPLTNH